MSHELRYGYMWKTMRGATAFMFRHAGLDAEGRPLIEGMVYEPLNAEDGPWSGIVSSPISHALKNPVGGRVPEPAILREKLLEMAADDFDNTVRIPSGTY